GYLHFSADELLEPASRIERAILEHAGMSENIKDINTQLMAVLESLNEDQKRKLIFEISNDNKGYKS
ncbi:hypothetical protein K6102_07290, partial [Vibrio furnissii]